MYQVNDKVLYWTGTKWVEAVILFKSKEFYYINCKRQWSVTWAAPDHLIDLKASAHKKAYKAACLYAQRWKRYWEMENYYNEDS